MTKKYLSVKRKDNFEQFESYLTDPNLETYILRLPNDIYGGGGVGRSSALTQLIATWADRSDSPRLESYIDSNRFDKYKDFVSNLHGLSAVYFSNHVSGKDSNDNIRYKVLKTATSRIHAMYLTQLEDVVKKRDLELISVLGAKREFLPALYRHRPSISELLDRQRHGNVISSSENMNDLFLHCMDSLKFPPRSEAYIEQLAHKNRIGKILHEAFRNTAEHAYLTTKGDFPRRGLRCIVFKINTVSRENFSNGSQFSSKFQTTDSYFEKLANLKRTYTRKHIDILEISILDTGPGFAKTIKSSSSDLDNSELVARCFKIRQTRKLGKNSGYGLNRILSTVKELNGFIRFRTSNCEAVFTSEDNFDENFDPRKFINGNLANVVGTLLTICIPLAY